MLTPLCLLNLALPGYLDLQLLNHFSIHDFVTFFQNDLNTDCLLIITFIFDSSSMNAIQII